MGVTIHCTEDKFHIDIEHCYGRTELDGYD